MAGDYLYVIHDEGGYYKVGRSADPAARLAQLQTGNPRRLRLACVVTNGGFLEPAVHAALGAWRSQGEWFPEDSPVKHLVSQRDTTAIRAHTAMRRFAQAILTVATGFPGGDMYDECMVNAGALRWREFGVRAMAFSNVLEARARELREHEAGQPLIRADAYTEAIEDARNDVANVLEV